MARIKEHKTTVTNFESVTFKYGELLKKIFDEEQIDTMEHVGKNYRLIIGHGDNIKYDDKNGEITFSHNPDSCSYDDMVRPIIK